MQMQYKGDFLNSINRPISVNEGFMVARLDFGGLNKKYIIVNRRENTLQVVCNLTNSHDSSIVTRDLGHCSGVQNEDKC